MIDEMGVITAMTLVNHFDLSPKGAESRIYRLSKAGLIEPLGIERGKWALSNKGLTHLEFLLKEAAACQITKNKK